MSSPSYSNPAIAAVVQDQQLERLNFATGLRKDPAGYSQYQQQRIGQIMSDITTRKQSAFQKAQIDLGRYMDMHHNVNFYKTRSGDVSRITDAMVRNNNNLAEAISRDKDISKRQFEINEWYNYNKLETLFYLQLVFMSVMAMIIIHQLSKTGTITGGLAAVSYGLLGVILVVVGLYKYFYTEGARDVKLWHRRYFGSTEAPPPGPPACPVLPGSIQDEWDNALKFANKAYNAGVSCAENVASDVEFGLALANAGATAEMLAIQQGAVDPLEQLGGILSAAGNAICT